jgi:hypothetical protein
MAIQLPKPKSVVPFLSAVFGIGTGLLFCVALNKSINTRVIKTCNSDLYQIVYIPTAIGDSYGCISRAVLQGPASPIKP